MKIFSFWASDAEEIQLHMHLINGWRLTFMMDCECRCSASGAQLGVWSGADAAERLLLFIDFVKAQFSSSSSVVSSPPSAWDWSLHPSCARHTSSTGPANENAAAARPLPPAETHSLRNTSEYQLHTRTDESITRADKSNAKLKTQSLYIHNCYKQNILPLMSLKIQQLK